MALTLCFKLTVFFYINTDNNWLIIEMMMVINTAHWYLRTQKNALLSLGH